MGRRERIAMWSVEFGALSPARPRVEVLNCERKQLVNLEKVGVSILL